MTLTNLIVFPLRSSTLLSSRAMSGTSTVRSSLIGISSASNTWAGSNRYFLSCDTWNTGWRFANWEGKAISSYWSNPPRDLIRTKELRRKSSWAESPFHTSGSGHPQEHVISSLEFQGPPPTVCIGLLFALWSPHPVPQQPHLLGGLLQQLRSN